MSKEFIPRDAWYSAQSAVEFGSTFWLTEDGREVEITAVADDYRWSDKVYVGKVVRFLRRGLVVLDSSVDGHDSAVARLTMLKLPQSYLTESEKTLLMIEWPDPSDVLGYSGVSRTQLSIARYSGGAVINGHRYTYCPGSDELWRDDVLQLVARWRKDASREAKLATPTMAQASLLDGD